MDVNVPSKEALEQAEVINAKKANENLGFLSVDYGFLPSSPPLLAFSETHSLWDEIAEELPTLYKSVTIRKRFDKIPILKADKKSLDDKYLLRAATLLGNFAHAYYWLDLRPSPAIPESIMQPWQEVSSRLGKEMPFLSYAELVSYNWKFKNPHLTERSVENLSLLVETIGDDAERTFYLCMVEMLAVATPIISSVVCAQEAIVNHNHDSLKKALIRMTKSTEEVIQSFLKISPNFYSKTYVDPITWGKCVGILPLPWEGYGSKGPSGTASPYFHLLDTIIGRQKYNSLHGKNQLYYKEIYNAPNIKNFIDAVSKISIKEYVHNAKDKELRGLFDNLEEVYGGETGLLGLHRRKAYGYVTTVFKIGRSTTHAGTSTVCPFIERPWNEVNSGLKESKDERNIDPDKLFPQIKVTAVSRENPLIQDSINRVSFDIKKQGLIYRPGDRCGLWPSNHEALVDKTMKALLATDNDYISISDKFKQHFNKIKIYPTQVPDRIPLRDFLKHTKIRPLTRKAAEQLYALSALPWIRTMIDNHREDQWEFWDALSLIKDYYDVRRFWNTDPWHKENLCHILEVEPLKVYSISSDSNKNLDLTIKSLIYTTDTGVEQFIRYGTASNYIKKLPSYQPIKLIRPTSFYLPSKNEVPIVMIAGGSGIAPFIGFISQRLKQKNCGENWLFFGLKSMNHMSYFKELEEWVGLNQLNLCVRFSEEDVELIYDHKNRKLIPKKIKRGYITACLEENKDRLWELMKPKALGGKEAVFYICGLARYFESTLSTLRNIAFYFLKNAKKSEEFIYNLCANKRIMMDLFTNSSPANSIDKHYQFYPISEIVLHNNKKNGYWMVIDDEVYNISDFIFLHAGGEKTLTAFVGMDATHEYKAVSHHLDSSINAVLSVYKIGAVKKLNFSNNWGVTLSNTNEWQYITLKELYESWVNYLYLVVEMQNTFSFEEAYYSKIFKDEITKKTYVFALQSIIKLIEDILIGFLGGLISEKFTILWKNTVTLCAQNESILEIDSLIQALKKSPDYLAILHCFHELLSANQYKDKQNLKEFFSQIMTLSGGFLEKMKTNSIKGIKLFERHEDKFIESSSKEIIQILKTALKIIKTYTQKLNETIQQLKA